MSKKSRIAALEVTVANLTVETVKLRRALDALTQKARLAEARKNRSGIEEIVISRQISAPTDDRPMA